jgi:hypothetical protein
MSANNHEINTLQPDFLRESQVGSFEEAAERLRTVEPNHPQPSDLRPGELGAAGLAELVTAFRTVDALRESRYGEHHGRVQLQFELPGIGVLERVGATDHSEKICYKLTTPDQRELAVLVIGYHPALGMQVPHDARFAVTNDPDPVETRLHEYSDLRQYFMAPIGGGRGIKLQEWGGPNLDQTRAVLPFGLAYLSRFLAARRIRSMPGFDARYASNAWGELGQTRNMVVKPGVALPLAIDIPVVQRIGDPRDDF